MRSSHGRARSLVRHFFLVVTVSTYVVLWSTGVVHTAAGRNATFAEDFSGAAWREMENTRELPEPVASTRRVQHAKDAVPPQEIEAPSRMLVHYVQLPVGTQVLALERQPKPRAGVPSQLPFYYYAGDDVSSATAHFCTSNPDVVTCSDQAHLVSVFRPMIEKLELFDVSMAISDGGPTLYAIGYNQGEDVVQTLGKFGVKNEALISSLALLHALLDNGSVAQIPRVASFFPTSIGMMMVILWHGEPVELAVKRHCHFMSGCRPADLPPLMKKVKDALETYPTPVFAGMVSERLQGDPSLVVLYRGDEEEIHMASYAASRGLARIGPGEADFLAHAPPCKNITRCEEDIAIWIRKGLAQKHAASLFAVERMVPHQPSIAPAPGPDSHGLPTGNSGAIVAIELDSRLEHFVDDFLLSEMADLEFVMHRPKPRGMVLPPIYQSLLEYDTDDYTAAPQFSLINPKQGYFVVLKHSVVPTPGKGTRGADVIADHAGGSSANEEVDPLAVGSDTVWLYYKTFRPGGYIPLPKDVTEYQGDDYDAYAMRLNDAMVTALAVSQDAGLTFTRPHLGRFFYNATLPGVPADSPDSTYNSTHNNVLFEGTARLSMNMCPFLDTNPDADPDEKYKAITGTELLVEGPHYETGVYAMGSPDGIHWHRLSEEPILRREDQRYPCWRKTNFDSLNCAFYDHHSKVYRLFLRANPNVGMRSVQFSISKDFRTWTYPRPSKILWADQPLAVSLLDFIPRLEYTASYQTVSDIWIGNETIYMPNVGPFPGAPHMLLAPAVRCFTGNLSCDITLLVSRDGGHSFGRVGGSKGWISRPDLGCHRQVVRGEPRGFCYETIGIPSMVERNGPEGREMMFYVQEEALTARTRVVRYSLPYGRFSSLRGGIHSDGIAVTRLLSVPAGRCIYLNYDTGMPGTNCSVHWDQHTEARRRTGSIHVEILQPHSYSPFDGYTRADAIPLVGSGFRTAAKWKWACVCAIYSGLRCWWITEVTQGNWWITEALGDRLLSSTV